MARLGPVEEKLKKLEERARAAAVDASRKERLVGELREKLERVQAAAESDRTAAEKKAAEAAAEPLRRALTQKETAVRSTRQKLDEVTAQLAAAKEATREHVARMASTIAMRVEADARIGAHAAAHDCQSDYCSFLRLRTVMLALVALRRGVDAAADSAAFVTLARKGFTGSETTIAVPFCYELRTRLTITLRVLLSRGAHIRA